ncbi:unnamed protein product [Cylicostephanus goldi]|uniref:Uncharacterized protein n=1 Tax=Cylicostephanus goldi TaxID=71465 RepID=A0A3P7M7M6_CYLGO|nr:unnamed protein product [Cylicostephanus goldi]
MNSRSQQENNPSPCEEFCVREENLAQVLARCTQEDTKPDEVIVPMVETQKSLPILQMDAQEDTKPDEVIVPMVETQKSLPILQMGLPLPIMARESEEREGGGLVIGQNIAVDRF